MESKINGKTPKINGETPKINGKTEKQWKLCTKKYMQNCAV